METVAYIRVSTKDQELQNQKDSVLLYARSKSKTISRFYEDQISGYKDKRPGLNLLLDHARKRQFNHLIFWSIDRLSRKGILDTLQILNEFDNLNITYESIQDPFLSTSNQYKEIFIAIKSYFAKVERESNSERTKLGLERAKKEGKTLGRPKGSKDKTKRKRSGYLLSWEKGNRRNQK